ncbi:MAG: hypothetical protein WC929_07985 [Bacilli bacterium]|jgi:hypothetical protein
MTILTKKQQNIIDQANQIEYDVEYRKTDCESRQWVKLNAFWFDEMKECIPLLINEIKKYRPKSINR